MENYMSQQDDPKGVENAENTEIAPDDLDQISGGAFDTFYKEISTGGGAEFLNPQPLPPG
jgi:hypothetical protein